MEAPAQTAFYANRAAARATTDSIHTTGAPSPPGATGSSIAASPNARSGVMAAKESFLTSLTVNLCDFY